MVQNFVLFAKDMYLTIHVGIYELTLLNLRQTIKAYSELPNNPLANKQEFSFPNYRDKLKLAKDICGFFVWKIDRIRSDIDAVDIDPSTRNALPLDQELDAANAFHYFQPLLESDVSALIRIISIDFAPVTVATNLGKWLNSNLNI